MSSLPQLLLTLSLLFLTTTAQTPAPSFKCTSKSTCKSWVGYISPNTTTLSHIQSLFQVKTLRTLLGVNNLPPTTPPNFSVAANTTIKVPFPCRCANGVGTSNKVPTYKVVPGDGLFHIANDIFAGLVTYPQIQAANNIKNASLIEVGQKLWVPLPCSCDDVDGMKVVHYGHVVAAGSTFDSIAAEFGTSSTTLMSVNNVTDAKDLLAGQVLDVPLRACNSSVTSTSFDYPLLVPNGTYVDTAHNCVMCKCDAGNNFMLRCEPSGLKSIDWPTCPAMQCAGSNLMLGNVTVTESGSSCSSTTCDYAGYNKNQTILTTLANQDSCFGLAPGSSSDGSNQALKINFGGWSFAAILLSIQLVMLQGFL